jgi:alpha-galactosidase
VQLILQAVEVLVGARRTAAAVTSAPAVVAVGPVEVSLEQHGRSGIAWSFGNRDDAAVRVRSVCLVYAVVDAAEPVSMFRNGYQSWSPTGVARLGVDVDPSTVADLEFMQASQHADQRRVEDGELRSEWVTLLRDATPGATPLLLGFEACSEHDGTFRLRRDGAGRIELRAEAFLGDALIAAGEHRPLHGVTIDDAAAPADAKLDAWATRVGLHAKARVAAPYQLGWCSWYQYFHDVGEADLLGNLARSANWPFEVFQLDDGFQRAIGDWLVTNEKFPSTVDRLADAIAAEGRTPGLWLAPFLAAPDSQVALEHPGWLARHEREGRITGPLRAWWNPPWEGGERGFMYGLDTTAPEVLQHLEQVARDLVDAGFRYLKLDFTFAPSRDGLWSDPTRTPAQRVRAGFEAIRRGAGDDTFLLGCGVPLANVVGIVDGNRIGQDVAPLWGLMEADETVKGYLGVQPSTRSAYANTVNRSFMHRRLWLNDPDCLMLRNQDTALTAAAARTWAHAVGMSGGMALVSDDLALLGPSERQLLDEVTALGRLSDAAAIDGRPAHSHDLMDRAVPCHYAAAGYELTVVPESGTSTLTPPSPRA